MTAEDEFDPEFKKLLRKLITERLAKEAVAGRSWQTALDNLKDIFDIDRAEIERDIASLIVLKSWEKKDDTTDKSKKKDDAPPPPPKPPPPGEQGDKDASKKSPWAIFNRGGKPQYGEGVRAQVFEVVVRQGVVGAPWRSICAGPMLVNNIHPDEVQVEINRRLKVLGREPQTYEEGLDKKEAAADRKKKQAEGGKEDKSSREKDSDARPSNDKNASAKSGDQNGDQPPRPPKEDGKGKKKKR